MMQPYQLNKYVEALSLVSCIVLLYNVSSYVFSKILITFDGKKTVANKFQKHCVTEKQSKCVLWFPLWETVLLSDGLYHPKEGCIFSLLYTKS